MQSISHLIHRHYLKKAAFLGQLSTSIRSRLSPDLAPYCWVADITTNQLTIITNRAERATLLRYQQHEILKQLNEEFSAELGRPLYRLRVRLDHRMSDSITKPTKSGMNPHSSRYKSECEKLREILE